MYVSSEEVPQMPEDSLIANRKLAGRLTMAETLGSISFTVFELMKNIFMFYFVIAYYYRF